MPFFLVATSNVQPENVFLGVRTIIGSTVSEHCCRCQRLGSRTDHSVLYDTDYQQDDAQQIWRSKIYRNKTVSLPSTILLSTRFVFFQLVSSRVLLSKKKRYSAPRKANRLLRGVWERISRKHSSPLLNCYLPVCLNVKLF